MVTQINNLINLGINYRFQLYIFFHSNNNIEPSLKNMCKVLEDSLLALYTY